jgi:hypothetical protein
MLRELELNERAILVNAALESLPGRADYLRQVDAAVVVEDPEYADIGIRVRAAIPRLRFHGRSLPVDIDEIDENGELIGQVWIVLEDGYICGIEYSDYRDDRNTLPNVNSLVYTLSNPDDKMTNEFRF